jgi:protein O-GlcNAc transferase
MSDAPSRIDPLIAQGIAAQNAQRYGEAERAYRAALQIDRTNPQALTLLGTLAGMAGRFPMAIDLFLQALQRDPANADLYHNLGETYRQLGDTGKALPAFNRAIELRPDHWEAYRSAADAAIAAAQKAGHSAGGVPARELRRIAAQYLLKLGHRRYDQHLGGGVEIFREAVALDPENEKALVALGAMLQETGLSTEAIEVTRRAIALDPKNVQAYHALGNAYLGLSRWAEAEEAFRTAVALDPNERAVAQSLVSSTLMRWLYDDQATAQEIFNRHRAWGTQIEGELAVTAGPVPPFANSRNPDRKLRVAYLSGDFRHHSVGYFIGPLLAQHDPAAIEVFGYSETRKLDPMTESLRQLCPMWRETFELSDAALRAQLRADCIDIAIDLAGHTAYNRLRALAIKAAPVTATWLGYPATTGLSTIDWRITDALADPPGAERFYTEKLLRLPNGFLCYDVARSDVPEVSPLPARSIGQVTFGSFNNRQKLSSPTIKAWAAILAALPQSRLLLKAPAFIDPEVQHGVLDLFAAHGTGAGQIAFRGFAPTPSSHLATYAALDIALDPFPYNGTTTSCEAMWMGVPIVTLIGDAHHGRVGFDLLSRVGLSELAAPHPEAYVATAIALAQDLPRLRHIRGTLREQLRASAVCDARGFARSFEGALREMWRHWCEQA